MRIELTRTGGFAGMRMARSLDTDTMPASDADELTSLVDAANFFNLPADLKSQGADQFRYRLTVEKEGKTHTVEADERALPAELNNLVKRLIGAARGR